MRADWVEVELGEILKVSSGQALTAKNMSGSGFPVYGGNGVAGYHNEFIFEEPKLIIGRVGVKCGVTHITKSKSWVTDNALVVDFKIKNVNISYMQLRLKFEDLNKLSNSTAQPVISGAKLYNHRITLPPLPEQRAIVAKIEQLFSDLDNGIANLKAAQAKLDIYRQAVLKQAFEGELTREWREKQTDLPSGEKILEKLKVKKVVDKDLLSDLSIIPDQWIYHFLAYAGDLGRGKSKHRPRNDPKLFGGQYPFIQTAEVKAQNIVTQYELTYSDFGLAQSKLWSKGTLCITIAANIAETAFLGIDACFPDSIVGFKPYDDIINSKYIEYFFRANKHKISAYAPATAQKNINLNTLENLIIPYCSLQEQTQIVQEIEARLSVCDKLADTIQTSLQQAETLRQSILKKAFEGRLLTETELQACKAEADWMPAEQLLAQIKSTMAKG